MRAKAPTNHVLVVPKIKTKAVQKNNSLCTCNNVYNNDRNLNGSDINILESVEGVLVTVAIEFRKCLLYFVTVEIK